MLFRTICCIYFVIICMVVEDSNQIQYQGNTFARCLKQDKTSFISCAGRQAIETLQQFNELDNFTLTDGVIFKREDGADFGRSSPINFIDQDPTDFRSILENAGAVMGERSLQWDMGGVHPGLQLRVGPSISGGLLEFVIDPSHQYDDRSHNQHYDESTARIMTKKFLLPFLLGLKFNLATLLPLILGAIVLISKKAALLSKLALFISGFFGLSPLLGYSTGGFGGIGGLGSVGGYGLYNSPAVHDVHHIGSYKVIEGHNPRGEHHHDVKEDNFYEYDKKYLIKDRSSRLYERDVNNNNNDDKQGKFKTHGGGGVGQRNFVWAPSLSQADDN